MTIKVHIENQDQARNVEILERVFDKKAQNVRENFMHRLAPNCSTTVYVHLLKDIVIRELEP